MTFFTCKYVVFRKRNVMGVMSGYLKSAHQCLTLSITAPDATFVIDSVFKFPIDGLEHQLRR